MIKPENKAADMVNEAIKELQRNRQNVSNKEAVDLAHDRALKIKAAIYDVTMIDDFVPKKTLEHWNEIIKCLKAMY